MASPPQRLARALDSAIGAEIADHPSATSSGIPGVLPPWRVVVLVAMKSTPCAGAIQGVTTAKPRGLDACDRLPHGASLPAHPRPPTALKLSLRGF